MKTKKLNTKKPSGITLVALVVTIIILIILATISLNATIGEDGLIAKAKQAKTEQRAATVEQEVFTWKVAKELEGYGTGEKPKERNELIEDQLERKLLTSDEAEDAKKDGQVQIGSKLIDYGEDTPPTPPTGNDPTTVKDAKNKGEEFKETTTVTDDEGNNVVIPGKFKITDDSGETVQEGIVIEDSKGNQFVWIPVSNIDGENDEEGEKPIKKDDGTEVTITLGRYDNYTMPDKNTTPTPKQKGSLYADGNNDTYTIGSYFKEVPTAREASTENSKSAVNATAKHLKEFVESVERNHGYYMGRYEASYGSGTEFEVGTEATYYKPLVQKSKKYYDTSSKFTPPTETEQEETNKGTLWNYITQGNASKVCRNMYNVNDAESSYVESDLVNSYMWDTAIVYLQAMGNDNYANKKGYDINSSLANTGINDDHPCKIYDMAGNLYEWTTEYSTSILNSDAYPCVYRGGYYGSSNRYVTYRDSYNVTSSSAYIGFRPGLYVK